MNKYMNNAATGADCVSGFVRADGDLDGLLEVAVFKGQLKELPGLFRGEGNTGGEGGVQGLEGIDRLVHLEGEKAKVLEEGEAIAAHDGLMGLFPEFGGPFPFALLDEDVALKKSAHSGIHLRGGTGTLGGPAGIKDRLGQLGLFLLEVSIDEENGLVGGEGRQVLESLDEDPGGLDSGKPAPDSKGIAFKKVFHRPGDIFLFPERGKGGQAGKDLEGIVDTEGRHLEVGLEDLALDIHREIALEDGLETFLEGNRIHLRILDDFLKLYEAGLVGFLEEKLDHPEPSKAPGGFGGIKAVGAFLEGLDVGSGAPGIPLGLRELDHSEFIREIRSRVLEKKLGRFEGLLGQDGDELVGDDPEGVRIEVFIVGTEDPGLVKVGVDEDDVLPDKGNLGTGEERQPGKLLQLLVDAADTLHEEGLSPCLVGGAVGEDKDPAEVEIHEGPDLAPRLRLLKVSPGFLPAPTEVGDDAHDAEDIGIIWIQVAGEAHDLHRGLLAPGAEEGKRRVAEVPRKPADVVFPFPDEAFRSLGMVGKEPGKERGFPAFGKPGGGKDRLEGFVQLLIAVGLPVREDELPGIRVCFPDESETDGEEGEENGNADQENPEFHGACEEVMR